MKPTKIKERSENIKGSKVLDTALDSLKEIVIDGLRHGFFEYQITGEMFQEKKRRLIIKAGKSHRFIIPPEELN